MDIEIISIEGNIGSGKSTFVKNMESYCKKKGLVNIFFLYEPVDEWESIKNEKGETILSCFYKDNEKYSFAFQMMAYISRYTKLRKCIENIEKKINGQINIPYLKEKYYIVTERCLYTDKYVFAQMLHDDKKMSTIEYQIYNKWFYEFSEDFKISKLLYVNSDPHLCFDRIGKRDRTGESKIPLEYLKSCDKYHQILGSKMITKYNTKYYPINGKIDVNDNNYRILIENTLQYIMSS